MSKDSSGTQAVKKGQSLAQEASKLACEALNLIQRVKETNFSAFEKRLQVLELKGINRTLCNLVKDSRKETVDIKMEMEKLDTNLLVIKYKRNNLLREIRKCIETKYLIMMSLLISRSDRNIYPDIILDEGSWSPEKWSGLDDHQIMIEKLKSEVEQRRQLQHSLERILRRKEETGAILQLKKKKLDELKANLQLLLKSAKPVIEASKYDLDKFDKSNKLPTETIKTVPADPLVVLYEKLVIFVADRKEFKLRYFASSMPKSSNDSREPATIEEYLEDENACNHERRAESLEMNRNEKIPESYIQIIQEINDGIEPVEIFIKLVQSQSQPQPQPQVQQPFVLSLSLNHPEVAIEDIMPNLDSKLRDVIDVKGLISGSWVPFTWLQTISGIKSDSIFENCNETFSAFFDSVLASTSFRGRVAQFVLATEAELHEALSIQLSLSFLLGKITLEILELINLKLIGSISSDMKNIHWNLASNSAFPIDQLNENSSSFSQDAIKCLEAQFNMIKLWSVEQLNKMQD